jgi:hypothetical protein
MAAMFTGESRVARWAILPALVLATAGMLVAASSSFGQAAVEQYIPDVNPTGHHQGGGSGGGGGGGSGATAGSSGSASVSPSNASGSTTTTGGTTTSSTGDGGNGKKKAADAAGLSSFSNPPGGGASGGGNAPGTDFPLTTFLIIVIAVFLAGLLVYVLLRGRPLRRRLRRASL